MEKNYTNQNLFKQNWERASARNTLSAEMLHAFVHQAYPHQKDFTYEILSGGCANLNIKINFTQHQCMLLRVYLRDKNAGFREQKLAELIKPTIPIPMINYVGYHENITFAFTEFIPGISLRDYLLSHELSDSERLMGEVGSYLGKIAQYSWSKAGFFNEALEVTNGFDDVVTFIHQSLLHPIILNQLTVEIQAKIEYYVEKYATWFPTPTEKNLVHGDFDPANILVHFVNDTWEITGIIDWEFAFSGSTLWDIANMLRYAHRMPSSFASNFLEGLQKEGIILPAHWQHSIALLNIASLLDCLTRTVPEKQPQQCADILSLIEETLNTLER
jgi:Ser/Thr protein kinase RdoA (MazF antagonist)